MSNLSALGQTLLAEHFNHIATSKGLTPGSSLTFSVEPTSIQRLASKDALDGFPFLQSIKHEVVNDLKGQKVNVQLSRATASRTKTQGPNSTDRTAKDVADTSGDDYELFAVENDIAIPYVTIDKWAHLGQDKFSELLRELVRKSIYNNRLMVGWHGTSAAATTNILTSPLLQDVNKGWLQLMRDAGSVIGTGTVADPAIELGAASTPNLDSIVAMAYGAIEKQYKNGNHVVIVGDDILAAEEAAYFKENGRKPRDKVALSNDLVMGEYGKLPLINAPYFPDGKILITTLDNLSIYTQGSSWRKTQIDNPKRNQVEDYNSRNEGYVVEDMAAAILIDGVTVSA